MEAAKAAISKHIGNSGKHTTTHHEAVAPAVQHETVKPSRHEQVTTAVDREVHQDHYHTSVQPIKDTQTLPEQHNHNIAPVEHVHHEHDNKDVNVRNLKTEAAKFKDQQVVADTVHSNEVAPAVGGEHVHHHVHETVQPVVHKTTIQPEVVHTTVPVHEVHHNAAQHHNSVQLPTMTMDEYTGAGRTLAGRDTEKTEHFRGEPHKIPALAPVFGKGGIERGEQVADTNHAGGVNHNRDPLHREHREGGVAGGPVGGAGVATGTGAQRDGTGLSTTDNAASNDSTRKPSLMQKLNPKVDADGDGKKGIFS